MKAIKGFWAGIFFAGILVLGLRLANAQETFTNWDGDMDWSSASDLEVMLRAVEETTPTNSSPEFGTFWSARHAPGSRNEWPPMPANINGLPLWNLGSNVWLVDDLSFSYDAARTESLAGGGVHAMDDSPFPDGFTNGGYIITNTWGGVPIDYGTNLWIAQAGVASGYLSAIATNTEADVEYEIQSLTDLTQSNWNSEGFIYGSELTNWTPFSVAQNDRTNLFLKIRSWQDSTGTGIPDWWWLTYFGQITNVDAYASAEDDGYYNLQKFQLGLNPTNYYNPNPPGGFFGCLDSTGTNVLIEWTNAPGPVADYVIERGAYDPGTGYYNDYSPIATVSSNATFFEDVGANTNGGAQNYAYQLTVDYLGGSQSATGTWYFWWYNPYGGYGLPYGPPVPGNVYAYADSTETNVIITWTPAQGAATNYIINLVVFNDDTYSFDYYPVGQVGSNTTSFEVSGAITNEGSWNNNYGVTAIYPGGGLSQPVTTGINNTNPSPPTGFSATIDSTGTNVLLAWSPPSGITAVTNYIIYRGIYNTNTSSYNYSQIGEVSSGTASFEDVGAITGNNSYNNAYEIVAVYANGDVSPLDEANLPGPPPVPDENIYITAYLVRNGAGLWQIMFSGFPTNSTQTIQLTWTDGDGDTTQQNISTANLTNGIYQIPNTDAVNFMGDTLSVQLFGTDGGPGQVAQAGTLSSDAPYFVDGRQHMKQNLTFLIRAAALSKPFGGTYDDFYDYNEYVDFSYASQLNQSATNFEEFSFLNHGSSLDDLWPFTANYYLSCFLLNTNTYDQFYAPTNQFIFEPDFETNIPAPAILTNDSGPYWIRQQGFLIPTTYFEGDPTNWGITVSEDSGGHYFMASLQSSLDNLFGLPEQTGCVIATPEEIYTIGGEAGPITNVCHVLAPGGSVTLSNSFSDYSVGGYASQCPAPALLLNNYYFAPLSNPNEDPMNLPPVNQQAVDSPIDDAFNVTNQTPLIVGTVGQPMIVGGWAKFSVSNSSPTKFAYLGQYFETNTFLLDTNGNVTTNIAGVISPYGEFLPLQTGQAELVTMPDIDTGQQGTDVVNIVSMNVDANHDGTMDLSYSGPDQTSPSRPFRFWINDTDDSGDDGGDGIPAYQPWYNWDGYKLYNESSQPYYMSGSRNLVNFFPVYLNIGSLFQSNAWSAGISATDTNWQFVLSQADGVLRFAYTDLTPTNYMNFLWDTNEAQELGGPFYPNPEGVPLTTISSSGVALSSSFIAGIATNNQGIILVEAATNTTQPLVLTIYHGTNKIAQTQLYLSISGVEQMFRNKTIMLNSEPGEVPDRLTDAEVPNEPDTTDNNFVFVHGYNVNPQQARGWDADIYKRLYWSGSHAKFYGVTWEAADSQVDGLVTINLQTNIVNAFNTAPFLNDFLNSLSGTNIVAAHSLGNMVVLSVLNDYSNQTINTYFMIDAAVAINAIDTTAPSNPDMYPSAWTNYSGNLWASDWYALFPTNDYRSSLTWWGRLANLQNASVYNFYSSGEEVLRDYPGDPPDYLLGIAAGQLVSLLEGDTGEYTWAWQEKLKGLMPGNGLLSSDHGGWQFNEAYETYTYIGGSYYWEPESPTAAAELTTSQLQTNAFFSFATQIGFVLFTNDLALETSSGSSYAQANRNRILSDAIPCLTLPVGANSVPSFDDNHNINMQDNENNWPLGRLQQQEGNNWHHSDIRAVAYTFTYEVFNQIVNDGNLK